MTREWKPGDVQVVLSMHASRVQEFAHWLRSQAKTPDARVIGYAEQIEEQGHGAHLVVIDPDDREQVERLRKALQKWGYAFTVTPGFYDPERDGSCFAAALREFADPKPPKPEEPTGLGAVVEDADGELWVQFTSKTGKWWRSHQGENARWTVLKVVRVLSEGVTP